MAEFKEYTFADVATRNGRNGQPLWMVYKDSIYDLTKYMHEHPGGDDVLMDEAGKDATRAFDDVGHSSDAKHVMTKHKVGEIVEEEKRYDANGKKRKRVVAAPAEKPEGRSCFNVVTCGLLG
ncbi:cytochrome b5-like [Anticarsia gemmatalis]|uniref:cytochrome b5-like n=1 Tax=Anticarsia gemmatalis TaxID=129554 RepID=UPI003F764EF7